MPLVLRLQTSQYHHKGFTVQIYLATGIFLILVQYRTTVNFEQNISDAAEPQNSSGCYLFAATKKFFHYFSKVRFQAVIYIGYILTVYNRHKQPTSNHLNFLFNTLLCSF